MTALATTLGTTFAGIAWDPTIRGLLAVGVGIVVLIGSVYLLLGTNIGARLGFLITAAGTAGFLCMLCFIWWIYAPANGPRGRGPAWHVVDTNIGDVSQSAISDARALDTSALPPPDEIKVATPEEFTQIADEHEPELHGWELLSPSDPTLGEASAAVDAHLESDEAKTLTGFEDTADYILRYAFETGGKDDLPDDPDRWDRIAKFFESTVQLKHPTHYALIQVQGTIDKPEVPGEPPPTPEPDPDAPVVSVILERDIGEARLPAGLSTIGFGLLFWLLCWMLHRRDQRVTQLRALPVGG